MGLFVLVCNLLYVVVGTCVSIRLLRLSRRTGGMPERIIGVGLLSFSLVCQPLLMVVSGGFGLPPRWVYHLLMVGVLTSSTVTVLCLYAFAWRVFRPQATWAMGLVAAGGVVALVSSVGAWREPPTWSGEPVDRTWMAASSFNYVVCFLWAGGESLAYYVRMRRRAAIGLGDPELQNRFGLWGGAMVVGALLSAVVGVGSAVGLRIGVDPLPSLSIAASGLVNSAGWWLSFAPPAAYLNRVRARAATRA